jgi:hypothetical protein
MSILPTFAGFRRPIKTTPTVLINKSRLLRILSLAFASNRR